MLGSSASDPKQTLRRLQWVVSFVACVTTSCANQASQVGSPVKVNWTKDANLNGV